MIRSTKILASIVSVVGLSLMAFAESPSRAFVGEAPPKPAEPKKESIKPTTAKSKTGGAKKNADKKPAPRKGAEANGKGLLWVLEPWNAVVRGVMNAIAVVDPVPPRPVPVQRNKAQEEALVKQYEQQYGAQFRRLYKSELHFMRMVCKPTRRQFERIVKEGPTEKEIVRILAVFMYNAQQGRRDGSRKNEPADPRQMIAVRLAKSLQSTFSAEQASLYQKELDQRDVTRKRVALLGLVAKVDKLLNLTAEQRVRLNEILEKNWRPSWSQANLFMWNYDNFPLMPDDQILAILTKAQKAVWRSVPKGQVWYWFDWDYINGWWNAEMEEEQWGDEPSVKNQQPKEDKAAANSNKMTNPEKK